MFDFKRFVQKLPSEDDNEKETQGWSRTTYSQSGIVMQILFIVVLRNLNYEWRSISKVFRKQGFLKSSQSAQHGLNIFSQRKKVALEVIRLMDKNGLRLVKAGKSDNTN